MIFCAMLESLYIRILTNNSDNKSSITDTMVESYMNTTQPTNSPIVKNALTTLARTLIVRIFRYKITSLEKIPKKSFGKLTKSLR